VGDPTTVAELTVALPAGGWIECGPKPGGYDDSDRELLTTLVAQASTAIENVALTAQLAERLEELGASRARIVAAADAERRRIERDLHDGVQQRLVALGVLLGRARRSGDAELVRQAHEEVQEALRELREVSWRVYPISLDESGLGAALESLAERAAIPVEVRYTLNGTPPLAVATVIYFVASESVTNAVKHSGATRITIDVHLVDWKILVEIADDGFGGARAGGTGGLTGLRRRVAAADGEFTVDSPEGGPTVVRAVLSCG
jgi:signal transduction histidine kinase